MSEITPGGAPAPEQTAPVKEPQVADLDLNKFFGPAAGVDIPAPVASKLEGVPPTPVEIAPDGKPVVKAPEPEPPKVESEIAAALREMREQKAQSDQTKQEVQTWKGKYDDVVQELEAIKSAPKFEDDPLEYVRARKWTPEQQKEVVELLAYDLNPAAAPPDFRFRVFESKQARKEREAQERAEAQRAQELQAQEAQIHQAFITQLDAAASTFSPEAYPVNDAVYGDDRRMYVTALYRLANELAEEAQSKGQRADLSAEALAAKLEQRNADKLAAIEARRSKRAPKQEPAKLPEDTKQSVVNPVSTTGLREGAPRPPATTEEERIKRATEVAFATR